MLLSSSSLGTTMDEVNPVLLLRCALGDAGSEKLSFFFFARMFDFLLCLFVCLIHFPNTFYLLGKRTGFAPRFVYLLCSLKPFWVRSITAAYEHFQVQVVSITALTSKGFCLSFIAEAHKKLYNQWSATNKVRVHTPLNTTHSTT